MLLAACSDSDNDQPEEKVLKLTHKSITFSVDGGEYVVGVSASQEWTISNTPTWLTVSPDAGDKNTEITIVASKNTTIDQRIAELQFVSGTLTQTLKVEQTGIQTDNTLPALYIFGTSKMEYLPETDSYNIETDQLFVNKNIVDKIFAGNLISYNATPHTDIPAFEGYTFNDNALSTTALITPIDYTPSLAAHKAYAKTIIDSDPKQSVSWQTDNGSSQFYSYKQLHNIGMIHLGVELDKVISGKSYVEQKMSKKHGFIYSYKMIAFTIDMDLPYDGKVVKEELKEADKAKGVGYIPSVDYGRIGLLIVETDADPSTVRKAINTLLAKEQLSTAETSLIRNSSLSLVTFDNNNQVQVKQGHEDMVAAYDESAKDRSNIYPLQFMLSNYNEHNTETIRYNYQATK